MSQNNVSIKDKWTPEQVIHLLEVYAGEEPLYKTSIPEYHNRRVRAQCLERVLKSVQELRPQTTVVDINKKIHSLRNGFNAEHKKVVESKRSGAGTDNVYTPTLFYYTKALFFAEYFVSRKSHSTKIGGVIEDEDTQSTIFNSTMLDSTQDSETCNQRQFPMDHDDYTLPGPSSRSRATSIESNSMDGELECSQVIDYDCSEEVISVNVPPVPSIALPSNPSIAVPSNPSIAAAIVRNGASSASSSPSDTSSQSSRQRRDSAEHETSNQSQQSIFRRPASPAATSTSSSSSSSSGRRRKRALSPNVVYEKLILDTLKEKPVEPPKGDPIQSFLEFVGGVLRKLPSGEQDRIMQSIFAEVMSTKATHSIQL